MNRREDPHITISVGVPAHSGPVGALCVLAYPTLHLIQVGIELRNTLEDSARRYRLHDIQHFPHWRLWIDDDDLSAARLDGLARPHEASNAGAAQINELSQIEREERDLRVGEDSVQGVIQLWRRIGIKASAQRDSQRGRLFITGNLECHVCELLVNRLRGST